ncbi:hypothetical protein [uncultured Methanoregula sp.]|uniref:hypothetical protein n=1 Tax=uncultured Methanoregula sp. TaxID=1005933 RepID=UPI002AAB9C61|nr:hypothetical protein [uncultured Methanoregula sp.]
MTRPGTLLAILMISLLLAAGCTTPLTPANAPSNSTATISPTPTQSVAAYKVTVSQPDAYSRYIHMDSDIYNAGEVVEFVVTNDGKTDLKSPNNDPWFSVIFQTGNGRWATKMGPATPVVSNTSVLRPGESSKVYRFLSEGWEAGRYRIVSDYGIQRDFLIRKVTPPAVMAACTPVANTTPWIVIDGIPDHVTGQQFTITGTTNVAAGKELRYTIFAPGTDNSLIPLGMQVSIPVVAGSCGTNTWAADVMMPDASVYFIGITEETKKAAAIKRFTILKAAATTSPTRAPVTPGMNENPVPPTPQVSP